MCAARFCSPFASHSDYNGIEKERLARHADLVFYRLFYDTPEKDLWQMFIMREYKKPKKDGEEEDGSEIDGSKGTEGKKRPNAPKKGRSKKGGGKRPGSKSTPKTKGPNAHKKGEMKEAVRKTAASKGNEERKGETKEEQTSEGNGEKDQQVKEQKPKKIDRLGVQFFASNLLNWDFNQTKYWRKGAWIQRCQNTEIPWRRIFTEYLQPLARLSRALHPSYTRRSRDEDHLKLAVDYIDGCFSILGEEYLRGSGLLHRMIHMLLQAPGRYLPLPPILHTHVLKQPHLSY